VKLLALFRAGRLPSERVAVRRTRKRRTGDETRLILPRYFGWLLVPCEAANHASQPRLTLAEPYTATAVLEGAARPARTFGNFLSRWYQTFDRDMVTAIAFVGLHGRVGTCHQADQAVAPIEGGDADADGHG